MAQTVPIRMIPRAAFDLARSFEKKMNTAYDSDGSGTPTWGYGHTRGVTMDDVKLHRVASDEQIEQWLQEDMSQAALELLNEIGQDAINVMTDNQYAAMVDFMFNLGEMGPTLRSLLRAKKFDPVPSELVKYVYVHIDGKAVKINGLVRRRNAEVELWSAGEPNSMPLSLPSSVTTTQPTPPAPSAETAAPMITKPSVIAAGATAVATSAAAVQPVVDATQKALTTVNHTIAPYADNDHVAKVSGFIIASLAALSVASLGLIWLQHWAAARGRATSNGTAKPVNNVVTMVTPTVAPAPAQPSAASVQAPAAADASAPVQSSQGDSGGAGA